jgi:hypothetical protein
MCGQRISGTAEISFISIPDKPPFVKRYFCFFQSFFGYAFGEVIL